jgi:CRP-like cAMP-binding protein
MTAVDPLAEVPEDILSYLGSQNTLTLATASRAGVPHAATYVYASEHAALYICIRLDTTTAKNLAQNPLGYITIDSYHPDWSRTRGVQCSVEATQLHKPTEVALVTERFKQKFPAVSDIPLSRLAVYRIIPTSIVFIDNGGDAAQARAGMEHRASLVYSVFHNLPEHEVATVSARMETLEVNSGEIVVRQGAPADNFFIIQDGEFEVIFDEGGQARTVARLQRGQFFGEMAILRNMPRTATVRAVCPSTLLVMSKDAFLGIVAQSLATSDDFDQIIHRRLTELAQPKTDDRY